MSRGTYILILHLHESRNIQIGKLGAFAMPSGFYGYVGSAFGSGGLAGRLNHHRHPAARPHWHIDYLRQAARLDAIWIQESDLRREHEWASILQFMPGVVMPIPRFGASDCSCTAHLFLFGDSPPLLETFRSEAARHFPNDAPISIFPAG